MAITTILQLGDPRLYQPSTEVAAHEVASLAGAIADLHDTMAAFQDRHGWGRAIAAPQIGVHRRIVAMNDGTRRTLINPALADRSEVHEDYWEDCMSFPDLLARIRGTVACTLTYRDESWAEHTVRLEGDYAHLIEHEVDHLDGVLAVQRVIGDRGLALRATQLPKDLELRGCFRPVAVTAPPDGGEPA